MSNDCSNIWKGPQQLNEDLLLGVYLRQSYMVLKTFKTMVDWVSILGKS